MLSYPEIAFIPDSGVVTAFLWFTLLAGYTAFAVQPDPDRAAIDISYASHVPIYDWLFGTHHLLEREWPEAYGVIGGTVPRGYWRQFVHPFQKPKPKEPTE